VTSVPSVVPPKAEQLDAVETVGVAESPARYDADSDYEHQHRCAEHEHDWDWGEEPEPWVATERASRPLRQWHIVRARPLNPNVRGKNR
jgi:hypothetical protein